MKILLFGILADATGTSVIEVKQASDIETLRKKLISDFPLLNDYSFQIAVNKEKIERNISLKEDDEIALLPAFAGG